MQTQAAINHRASTRPVEVIESLARRPDQKPSMRQYARGFEDFFNNIPILKPNDHLLDIKTMQAGAIMKALAAEILNSRPPAIMATPPPGEFSRVILGVEEPNEGHEGSEILIAQWGKDFTSPVHGHAAGLLYEEILSGRILVHTYRYVSPGVVRPLRSEPVGVGTLVSRYSPPDLRGSRMSLVHNFTAIEPSVTMHFVPEHTRDGRDNGFQVEHFKEIDACSVSQINGDEGRQLQIGDVALVRSTNVKEYGDHYIVIVGPNVLKDHGLRPMDVAIQAGVPGSSVLDQFQPGPDGLILLKLSKEAKERFFEFHGITMAGERMVMFPEA